MADYVLSVCRAHCDDLSEINTLANASVRLDLDFVLDGNGHASYWMLVEAVTQAFHIQNVEQIVLFYVTSSSSSGTSRDNNMREISNDRDLSKKLATAEVERCYSDAPLLHRIHVIDSVILLGKHGKKKCFPLRMCACHLMVEVRTD